jgi:hypothetical protein
VGKVLEDFNAKLGRENILKPTVGKENLHRISNENEDRLSKYNRIKSTMFSHSNIHKFTSMFPDDKTCNQIDHVLIDRQQHSHVIRKNCLISGTSLVLYQFKKAR